MKPRKTSRSYLTGWFKAGKKTDHAYNNHRRAQSEADEYRRKHEVK